MNSYASPYIDNIDTAPKTLDAFLSSVEKRAYRMAYVALKDRDEALDAVQDTMMKMFQKSAHKPPLEWRPLFYRILSNRITDSHRSNQVKKRLQSWFSVSKSNDEEFIDPLENVSSRTGDQPQHRLQSEQSMSVLDTALNALPIRQQQAFLLRQWEGLSTEETAKAMGCSTGSVKTHLSRSLSALKATLQPHYEHYE